jgi:hypothetical protein
MKQQIITGKIFSLALAVILLFAANVLTQTFYATIVGKVTDLNGANVPNATVTITQKGTNRTQTVTTNSEGEYTVTQLQPGEYTLKISYTGFKISLNENITLQTDTISRVNVTLETGDINETVTINSEPSVVNSETPEKGEVIVQRQVQELPLNVRDYTELAKLVPGIYQRPSDDDQGQGVASAGTRTDASNFILDGVANRNDRNGGVGVNTSVDSIQEFKVSTSTYSAEYGRLAGAQINVVSKSGTNRFSGTAFEFIRNDFFDANNALVKPGEDKVLRRHQFGGTLGGPLPFPHFGEGGPFFESGKDKTFFFLSFEQLREVRSQSQNSEAPNAAWARGDFRNVRGPGPDNIPGNADDTGRVMCLQRSSNPLRPTRVECPTPNVIPLGPVASNPNLLYASPVSLAILQYLPLSTQTDPANLTDYSFSNISNILPRNLFSVKVDRKLTDSNNFYLRYSRDDRDAYQPQAGRVNYPGFLRDWEYRQYSFAFGDTHNFSPTVINEFRFGVLNQDNKTLNENNDRDYIGLFGIPGLPTGQTPELQGFPAIRIDGFPDTGDSANVPFNYLYKNLSFSNALTWITGNNSLKFGVDVIRPNYIENDIRNVRGDFRFRGRFTNSANAVENGFRAFADFLYGIPDSTQRQLGAEAADLVAWQSAFYVQDNWRITPWLTLNLGLRYDYTPFLYEKRDRISNFIPQLGVAACADGEYRNPTTNALICVSRESLGLPRALVKTDSNNLAPRLGFALKPFKDDKTVLRGGAGIFFSTETINPARQQLALNYPFINRQSFNRASTADILQLTFSNPFPDNRASLQGVTTPLGIPTDSQTPEVYQFNLTLERELVADLGFEIGYVGSQGRHLGVRYDLNYAYPTGAIGADGQPVTAVTYPQFGQITYQIQALNSSYHAMQVALRRRARNGLTFLASYTFGKAMDQNSNTNNSTTGSQRNPQNIRDFGQEWALADYHRTHQFSASFNYDLPFGRGRKFFGNARGWSEIMFGGWQLNGIVTMLSGRPFTPVYSTPDTAGGRPDLVSDPMQNVPAGLYFNPLAFRRPVATPEDPNEFGSAGRNIVIGPNFKNVDMSLFKNIKLTEKSRLQLRWEVFNVFNRANFQIPQHLLGTEDTGEFRLTSNEAREMQFAIRFIF